MQNILGSEQDAEDVTADVFFEVWSRRDRFDPRRGSLRTYVLMLARCRAIDLYRSKAKERKHLEPKSEPARVSVVNKAAVLHARPHQVVSMKEFEAMARNAISELGQNEKDAIELAFFEGLSHPQIANRLDSPLGTVKSNIRRGLAKLRKKLSEWES